MTKPLDIDAELLKQQLLMHYAEQASIPQEFLQIDGWHVGIDGADYVMRPDEDGDVLTHSSTLELRRSPSDLAVRVFIHEDASCEDVVRLLQKIADDTAEWLSQHSEKTVREMQGTISREIPDDGIPF